MKTVYKGIGKQAVALVGTYFEMNLLAAIVGILFVTSVLVNSTLNVIFTLITIAVCLIAVYMKAWDIAESDRTGRSGVKPHIYKGAMLPIGIILFGMILLGAYLFAWRFLTIDGQLSSATAYIYNVAYIVSTFAFNALLGLSEGGASVWGHIIMYLLTIAASTVGYIAGLHDFSVSARLTPFVYEKKNKG